MASINQTSQNIGADYMNLLVAQLRHQNPLEPMDNQDMAMQLAALSQLEQTEQMNASLQGALPHLSHLDGLSSTFEKVLAAQQLNQAAILVGKEIRFRPEAGEGEAPSEPVTARVDAAGIGEDGVRLTAGGHQVRLEDIIEISD